MHAFESTGIVTGYIKQLLASFELPKAKVYTDSLRQYYINNKAESSAVIESFDDSLLSNFLSGGAGDSASRSSLNFTEENLFSKTMVPYLKDGNIQYFLSGYYMTDSQGSNQVFIPGKWQTMPLSYDRVAGGHDALYSKAEPVLNFTKTFQIKNNVYDSYTHEYLGDYLRFIRDLDGIDLMPLYNCFSNRLCANLNYKQEAEGEVKFELVSTDSRYKIYMLPAKVLANYTIAIDSPYPVECCCGFYNIALDESELGKKLLDSTYRKYNHTYFHQPILYDALTALQPEQFPKDFNTHLQDRRFLSQVAMKEDELKLFIKVSAYVDSTITVLEGNYLNWNNCISKLVPIKPIVVDDQKEGEVPEARRLVKLINHTEVHNDLIFSGVEPEYITPLQLLAFNTKAQVPFSDRLLEYLLEGCITGNDEEARDNVVMAQQLIKLRYKATQHPANTAFEYPNGIWSEDMRKIFYQYMTTSYEAETQDSLGYVDKDVERLFTATVRTKDAKSTYRKTMLSYDAWEDAEQ